MDEEFSNDFNVCNGTDLIDLTPGSISTTMVSSAASVVGSCLIILSYIIWSDLRTTARAILVFLAIADLLTALGYLFASILFLINNYEGFVIPPSLCTFQSFITTAFPISSFLWTANLAVFLFVTITLNRVRIAKKMMFLFHVVAWGIPLLLCIPGAATMVLGGQTSNRTSTQGTVAWCWVSFDNKFDNQSTLEDAHSRIVKLHLLELVFGKLWEISVFFIAITLCLVVKISLHKKKKELNKSKSVQVYGTMSKEKVKAALEHLDQRLIWIPTVFVLFRAWGTLRWLIATTYPQCQNIDPDCSVIFGKIWFSNECLEVIYHPFLVYMQSIGDTGQGWGNALLYVIFNATIFKRLCPYLYFAWRRIKMKFARRKENYGPVYYTHIKSNN